MGGLSPEREISLTSGKEVFQALLNKGFQAISIDVDHKIAATLVNQKIEIAFIALHGTFGEDGTIQGLLEYLKIPYTGSGVLGSSMAYNKIITKEILEAKGIPSAPFQVFTVNNLKTQPRTLDLPVVVKPPDQGSSLGVSIVKKESEWFPALELAFKYSKEVLVEKFIQGKQLAVGMNQDQPLPIVHIEPKSGFYDYEAKYTKGKTQYFCPAELTDEEAKRCNQYSIEVFRALKGRGFPRVDFILDKNGTPFVLEMNTIPGMTPTSLLPMAAKQSGMGFEDLVVEITKTASLDYMN